MRSDRGRGSKSPFLGCCPPGPTLPLEIIDLSKFGRGTDNSRTGGGGGGGRVSFDFMRPSRLMEGLNVVMVMALSGVLRASPGVGVVAAALSAWETFLL